MQHQLVRRLMGASYYSERLDRQRRITSRRYRNRLQEQRLRAMAQPDRITRIVPRRKKRRSFAARPCLPRQVIRRIRYPVQLIPKAPRSAGALVKGPCTLSGSCPGRSSMLQSWGSLRVRQSASAKSVAWASMVLSFLNFQSASNKVPRWCWASTGTLRNRLREINRMKRCIIR